jgi:glycine cleavage system H protein
MRNAYERPESVLPVARESKPLRPGRFYTAEHCWVDVRGPKIVRIGVEPGFAVRLNDADGISLPPSGKLLHEREAAVWCRFDDAMVPIRLPFDMRVREGNRRVRSRPALVGEDPYEAGWLLEAEVVPDHLDERRVMSAGEAEKMYVKDEEVFHSTLGVSATAMLGAAGPTMQDGGEVASAPLTMMGAARYCALVGRIYCKVV